MQKTSFKITVFKTDNEVDLNHEVMESNIREQNHFIQTNYGLHICKEK